MKEKQTKLTDTVNESLKTALLKKALGYSVTETVEEYVGSDEGEIKLLKKKVTKKKVPPDVTALKMLIDENKVSVSEYTDEQLEIERQRLLRELTNKSK
ncbi:MAG: hypothetical protein IKA12_00070 [Clostridia bacterium]|nr:hypothetical protein [Clostridia bacterium]